MENKQTAVEWLYERYRERGMFAMADEFEQAKQMEAEQSADSKRSQLKNELATLNIQLDSRYNAYGHIEPSLEQQKIIRDRIDVINEELKNIR